MNDISPATEIALPFHLPAEVAAAIVAVAAQIRQIGQDERNPHGGYPYVSVDKFYERVGPLMAAAGLFLLVDEVSADVREGAKGNAWLFTRYALRFAHASGLCSPAVFRSCAQPISGPQAFGSAQSYIEKQFLRQVFKIPTGDKDVTESLDQPDESTAPVSRGRTEPFKVPEPRMPRPPNKPIQLPPQTAVYDPETGEVGPHYIPVPFTVDGKANWVAWGRQFMDALQASKSRAEKREWIEACAQEVADCKERAPNAYRAVDANIRLALETADFMDPDDPLRPL